MQIRNIERLLCFAKENDLVLPIEGLGAKYGFEPDGSNFYYGINPDNAARFGQDGQALNGFSHRPFLDSMLRSVQQSAAREKTVVLGLEPPQMPGPYEFVANNLGLVRRLAAELAEYQAQAAGLRIVVRYASEMNDAGNNAYAGMPGLYQESFRQVRAIFAEAAPAVQFAFSPAIRRDLAEPGLTQYWPGDEAVDVISCTWYV